MPRRSRFLAHRLGPAVMRSFFPLVTLVIVLGTVLWGPWVSLLLAIAFWVVIDRLEMRF
jgi:hypothetical protein